MLSEYGEDEYKFHVSWWFMNTIISVCVIVVVSIFVAWAIIRDKNSGGWWCQHGCWYW
jgi:hypothetical protein